MGGRISEAIILAGGLGTRLRSEIGEFPKPLAAINGSPFLDFILDYLNDYGLKHVILAVGFKHELIQQEYGAKYKNLNLSYSIESTPLGTGGALKQALSYVNNNQCFVLNGDTYFKIDLNILEAFHNEHKGIITLATKEMFDFDRYGTVDIDKSGLVTGFNEKQPKQSGMINGGIYLVNSEIKSELPNAKIFSFETDVLEPLAAQNKIYACQFDDYFIDIGVPEDYKQFKDKLK